MTPIGLNLSRAIFTVTWCLIKDSLFMHLNAKFNQMLKYLSGNCCCSLKIANRRDYSNCYIKRKSIRKPYPHAHRVFVRLFAKKGKLADKLFKGKFHAKSNWERKFVDSWQSGKKTEKTRKFAPRRRWRWWQFSTT